MAAPPGPSADGGARSPSVDVFSALGAAGSAAYNTVSSFFAPPSAGSPHTPASRSSSLAASRLPSEAASPAGGRGGAGTPRRNYAATWLALTDDARFAAPELRRRYRELLHTPPGEDFLTVFDTIERDVARTFSGTVGGFDTQGARNRLRRVLAAYAMHDPEVGYVQSMNFIAGFMLMHMPGEEDAFVLLVRTLQHPKYGLRGCFLRDLPDVGVHSYVIRELLREQLPSLAGHLEGVGVTPLFWFEWYFALYTLQLPPPVVAEVWSLFFADGWSAIFKVMLVLLQHAERHMIGKDFQGTIVALKAYQSRRMQVEFPELQQGGSGGVVADSHGSGSSSSGGSSGGAGAGGVATPTSPPADFLEFSRSIAKEVPAGASALGERLQSTAEQLGTSAVQLIGGLSSRVAGALAGYPAASAVAARLGIAQPQQLGDEAATTPGGTPAALASAGGGSNAMGSSAAADEGAPSHLDALLVRARAQAAEEARLKRDEEALQAALRASVQTAAAEARAAAEAESADRDAAVAAVDAAAAAEAASGGS